MNIYSFKTFPFPFCYSFYFPFSAEIKSSLKSWNFRSSHRSCSFKKGVVRNFAKFAGKHLCQRLFFNKVAGLRPANLLKKESMAQVFSCEFCEISKSTFHKTPQGDFFWNFIHIIVPSTKKVLRKKAPLKSFLVLLCDTL